MAQKQLKNKSGVETPVFISESARVGKGHYIGAFAYLGENVRIGENVKIYPNSYIGDNVIIEDNTTIYPNVTVHHNCRIGKNCILHSGVVIGSDGFGFTPTPDGQLKKVPQTGIVVLQDEVEIGANTTIDRATLGETVIKKGVKIDNLVQIAHNVEIGEHTVIAGQSGISGSSKLGKGCMLGGQVGIAGHLEIADGTKFGAKAGVSKSFKKPNMVLRGRPAQELKKQLKSEALLRQLGDMYERIKELEAQIKNGQE